MPSQEEREVAIFWDLENCSAASSISAYSLVENIRNLAHTFGILKSFKAYVDVAQQPSISSLNYRAELQSSGVSVTDCPHLGQENVVDQMIIVDMLTYAMDHPPPALVLLISGERGFAYAVSMLRARRYDVVVMSAPGLGTSHLMHLSSVYFEWNTEVIRKSAASSSPRIFPSVDPVTQAPSTSFAKPAISTPPPPRPRRFTTSGSDAQMASGARTADEMPKDFGPSILNSASRALDAGSSVLHPPASTGNISNQRTGSPGQVYIPVPDSLASSPSRSNDSSSPDTLTYPTTLSGTAGGPAKTVPLRTSSDPTVRQPEIHSLRNGQVAEVVSQYQVSMGDGPSGSVPCTRAASQQSTPSDVVKGKAREIPIIPFAQASPSLAEILAPAVLRGVSPPPQVSSSPAPSINSNTFTSSSSSSSARTSSAIKVPPEAAKPPPSSAARPSNSSSTQTLSAVKGTHIPAKQPPPEFKTLVNILRAHQRRGDVRPSRSVVASELLSQDKSAYAKAGSTKFSQYTANARERNIVQLGSVGGNAWIALTSEYAG
ncbi:hypothetical protein HGRIS_013278 [Hohenbuehelia grisea]|uniref:NYN domain-containing protein n=1 Tax=Hohenbuehelia grisea TaxID=104357 RepID=A0ABR3IUY1_9AGAR